MSAPAPTPADESWSPRFLAGLRALGLTELLDRAAPLLTGLTRLEVTPGTAAARVQDDPGDAGADAVAWDVWIDVPVLAPGGWARLEALLAADPPLRAALREGRLPDRTEAPLVAAGTPLLPLHTGELAIDCGCGRPAPCLHAGALLLALARTFTTDPLALLAWRGRPRRRLLAHLTAPTAPAGADLPLAATLGPAFWQPPAALPAVAVPEYPTTPALHHLTSPGPTVRGRPLRDALAPLYAAMTDGATEPD